MCFSSRPAFHACVLRLLALLFPDLPVFAFCPLFFFCFLTFMLTPMCVFLDKLTFPFAAFRLSRRRQTSSLGLLFSTQFAFLLSTVTFAVPIFSGFLSSQLSAYWHGATPTKSPCSLQVALPSPPGSLTRRSSGRRRRAASPLRRASRAIPAHLTSRQAGLPPHPCFTARAALPALLP